MIRLKGGIPYFWPFRVRKFILDQCKLSSGGCWLWCGTKTPQGYGVGSIQGQRLNVHRVMFEIYHGPIPKGLHIDHLCRVRHCCRPDHLDVVTPEENAARGAMSRIAERAQAAIRCRSAKKVKWPRLKRSQDRMISHAFDVAWAQDDLPEAIDIALTLEDDDWIPEAEPLLSMVTQ